MATAIIRCPKPGTREFAHADAPSAFSSLATEQPQINLLAAWTLDENAPFGEQPSAERVRLVLCSVYNFEVRFTKQAKPASDIFAVIARLALRNGYAAISQITSASYVQSRGGRGSHSGRRNSGGVGQSVSRPTVPLGAGNGGGGPSKHPTKRGGDGDGEGNHNKKKKLSNEQQGPNVYYCIVFELSQPSPRHPCKDKRFTGIESAVDHYLRIHVGHIQCPTCFIRKGTNTDMGKHLRAENCTPPAKIRAEVETYGERVRKVKDWDELRQLVAPHGEIEYDMADGIDNLPQPPPGQDENHIEQPMAPYQMNPQDMPTLGDDFTNPALANHTMQQALDQLGYSPWKTGTINPLVLQKRPLDSGCPSSGPDIEYYHRHHWSELQGQTSAGGGAGQATSLYQYGEMRNHTSTVGGAGWLTSENEAPEQGLGLKLLERLNSVIEAFRECNKSPEGRQAARACARNIAFQVPKDVLQVFAEVYQEEYNPSLRAKGKEQERFPGVVDGA